MPTPKPFNMIWLPRRFIYSSPITAVSLTNYENLEQDVKKIFFEVFPETTESNFNWTKNQKEYDNWDSFAQLHLVSLAESKFNITLSVDETTTISSAQDLVNCIKSHL